MDWWAQSFATNESWSSGKHQMLPSISLYNIRERWAIPKKDDCDVSGFSFITIQVNEGKSSQSSHKRKRPKTRQQWARLMPQAFKGARTRPGVYKLCILFRYKNTHTHTHTPTFGTEKMLVQIKWKILTRISSNQPMRLCISLAPFFVVVRRRSGCTFPFTTAPWNLRRPSPIE